MSDNEQLPPELESEKQVFAQTVEESELPDDVGRNDDPPFDTTQ